MSFAFVTRFHFEIFLQSKLLRIPFIKKQQAH